MSNRLFQGLIHQMRDTMDCTIGVVDETANIIACSELSKIGTTNEFVSLDLSDSHDIFIRDGFTYKPFGSRVKPDYAVFVEGDRLRADDAQVSGQHDHVDLMRTKFRVQRFGARMQLGIILLSDDSLYVVRNSLESFFLIPEAVEKEGTVLFDALENVILGEV